MKRVVSFVLFALLIGCVSFSETPSALSPDFVYSYLGIAQNEVLLIGDLSRGYEAALVSGKSNSMLIDAKKRLKQFNGLPVHNDVETALRAKLADSIDNLGLGTDRLLLHENAKIALGNWRDGVRLFLEVCDVILQSDIPPQAKAQIADILKTESFVLRGEPYTGAVMADWSGDYHYILCVIPGSPADRAGIEDGDILHQKGSNHIDAPYRPQAWQIIRNGEERTILLTPILYGSVITNGVEVAGLNIGCFAKEIR